MVYVALVAIPYLIYSLLFFTNGKSKKTITIPIFCFFIFMIMLVGLRGLNIGNDTSNYHNIYLETNRYSWDNVFEQTRLEPIFVFLEKFLGSNLGFSYQFFLFFCAVISIFPIAIFYSKEIKNPILTIAIFLAIAPFTLFFSGIRQCIVIGLSVISYRFAKTKKIIPFIISVVFLYYIHSSAFILFFIYPLLNIRLKKNFLYFLIPFYVIFYFKADAILEFIFSFVGIYEKYLEIEKTGAFMMILLLGILTIFSIVIPDEEKFDQEEYGLRNILIFALILQTFSTVNTMIFRINYNLMIFIPIFIDRIIPKSKATFNTIAKVAMVVMMIFFSGYFIINTIFGADGLNIYPYEFYWN